MELDSHEELLDLLSIEDVGLGSYLGWYRDEAGTLRQISITEGEFFAAQRAFREDPEASVSLAR